MYDSGIRVQRDGVLRELEQEYLEQVAASVTTNYTVPAATTLLDGGVVEAICAHARECPDALVVMSTHGRTGFSRLWLGSIADGVLRHATTPVLMLRVDAARQDASSGWPRPFSRMVVPLDGSDFAEQALPHAMNIAAASTADVVLLHVVTPVLPAPTELPIPYVPPAELLGGATDERVRQATEYTTALGASLHESYPTLDIGTTVAVAMSPAQVIIDTAKERGAHLVVMSTHGRGVSRLVAASVADKVVRGGPGAVLLIRPMVD